MNVDAACDKAGGVTAGNASGINAGAAALALVEADAGGEVARRVAERVPGRSVKEIYERLGRNG